MTIKNWLIITCRNTRTAATDTTSLNETLVERHSITDLAGSDVPTHSTHFHSQRYIQERTSIQVPWMSDLPRNSWLRWIQSIPIIEWMIKGSRTKNHSQKNIFVYMYKNILIPEFVSWWFLYVVSPSRAWGTSQIEVWLQKRGGHDQGKWWLGLVSVSQQVPSSSSSSSSSSCHLSLPGTPFST